MSRRIYVTYQGRKQTLSKWARELGIPYDRLYKRWHRGYKGAALMSGDDHRTKDGEAMRVRAARQRNKES